MEEELKKAFEEVTTRNVRTIEGYSKSTRELVRQLENKITLLEQRLLNQENTINELRGLLANVQATVYRNGTV